MKHDIYSLRLPFLLLVLHSNFSGSLLSVYYIFEKDCYSNITKTEVSIHASHRLPFCQLWILGSKFLKFAKKISLVLDVLTLKREVVMGG